MDFSAEAGLASLAVASFLAATIVPFSSEAVLFAVLRSHGDLYWQAIGVATLGNTAGGMTSYLIGRGILRLSGERKLPAQVSKQRERVRRYGAPVLLFAWLPLVGDGLCVAAGWLRVHWIAVALWQAAGRLLRYWVVAQVTAG